MFHGAAFIGYAYMAYTKGKDRFRIEPFWIIEAVHGGWTLWALAGYLWA
jgi:hypothetical protein